MFAHATAANSNLISMTSAGLLQLMSVSVNRMADGNIIKNNNYISNKCELLEIIFEKYSSIETGINSTMTSKVIYKTAIHLFEVH